MKGMVSPKCEQNLAIIDDIFAEIKKTIEEYKNGKELAEAMLIKIRKTASEEIKRAYDSGFNDGIKYSSSSNTSGGTKLVYTKN